MLSEGISLLQKFEEFKGKNPNSTLEDFGRFLANIDPNHSTQTPSNLDEVAAKMPFPFPAKSIEEYLGWIWGRLQGFTQVWEKKAFEDLPIANLTEFGVIMYVFSHANCNKTEVATHTLHEKTTIFEIIKRLVKNGFLVESESSSDKRSKNLHLTEKGRTTAFIILERTVELSRHLAGDLSKEEKFSLFHQLAKLDAYHQSCYDQYKEDSWDSLRTKTQN